MKVVGIDVEALRNRYAELEAEMASINQVLAVVENTNLPGVTVTERARKNRVIKNNGVRRLCIMQLFTGPCTPDEIARVYNKDKIVVTSALRSMVGLDLASEEKNGQFALTSKGRMMAKWHTENPNKTHYHGPNVYTAASGLQRA